MTKKQARPECSVEPPRPRLSGTSRSLELAQSVLVVLTGVYLGTCVCMVSG